MTTADHGERRTAPRVPCRFMVRCWMPKRPGGDVLPLKDVSQDGARLVCEGTFQPGDPLELWLPIGEGPAPISASVVWQKAVVSGKVQLTELGVQFAPLDDEARQAVRDGVQRLVQH